MPADVSVVISIFGDMDVWRPLAHRAMASAHAQTKECEIVYSEGETLAEARNSGVEKANGDLIILLDADDELDVNYVEEMSKRSHYGYPNFCLLQPATLGVANGKEDANPVLIPEKPLDQGNFLVIGTAFHKALFNKVGGFQEWPFYEDWALFWKMSEYADIFSVPEAVYRVHVTKGSRNDVPPKEASKVVTEIKKEHKRWLEQQT